MSPTQADADTLYRRLESGWDKIEAAQAAARDTAFLEEFWLSLLREYEAVCQELSGIYEKKDEPQPEPEPPATQKGMFS